MTTTVATVTHTAWTHEEAMAIAAEEHDRLVGVLEGLAGDDWTRPTDCDLWTVRDLAGHVVGTFRGSASVRVLARQQLGARRRAKALGGDQVDHMTAIQVEEAAGLSTAELVAEARTMGAKAVAGRRRPPAFLRRTVRIPVKFGTIDESWTLGWFLDVCLTRDAWLHRIDLCRAVGRDPELTADHDGRIVADVVAEWARRHGESFHLVLTGPAGGRFGDPASGEAIELDAVELCRILSGRSTGTGLLRTEVPF